MRINEVLSEGTELAVAKDVSISGPHVDDLDMFAAIDYIKKYPDGALHHDIFERDNFVYLTKSGQWRFYYFEEKRSDEWDWKKDVDDLRSDDDYSNYDITEGWWYEPLDWKAQYASGNADWFVDLLNEK